ncbi:uncharacterized protein EV154DRAFT_600714 [Mucor mucedo]|uniref:uncharacterized protein n=1 Tax=Mucor mucedo TaxID=29922 RepID=UPI00221F9DAD|nr:uncharacterized protein EV154DRAFT_600714 [Mucor mucedo]KAI7893664.1 hypothetical protein EV154DRAFT_600714 [Mucor mucedo]
MKRLNIKFWLLLLATTNSVIAQVASDARFSASCGYLVKKIFCFGGAVKISTGIPSDAMSILDLTMYSGKTTDELATKWVRLYTNTENQNILPRSNPQSTQLPDGKTLLIVGGDISGNASGIPQTLSFNGETLSWDFYPNFEDSSFGNRQISNAASVYVPEYGFVLYGGLEVNYNNNFTYPGINATNYIDDGLQQRFIGYTKLEALDIRNTGNPWRPSISGNNVPNIFPNRQAAIFDAKNNAVFFFGGSHPDATNTLQSLFTFDTAITFNFTTKNWGVQNLNGQGPSPRYGHSANVVGPDKRHVLIYGGQNEDSKRPLSDYCYVLDLDTYQWTQQTIPASTGVVLARTKHSAVTITDNMLFIVYGVETEIKLAEKLFILNVTDPLNITLFDTFIDPASVVPANTTSQPTSETTPNSNSTTYLADASKKGLTSGAIIGIAVGISVAGLIAIATIIFCIIKKKNKKRVEKEREKEKLKEDSLMEVNWDELENKYAEAPPTHYPEGHFRYSSQLPDGISENETTQTPDSSSALRTQSETKVQRPDVPDNYKASRVN